VGNAPTDNTDELKAAAKKGGKEILSGFSKGGMVLTKRIAEGALRAELAQSNTTDTLEKIKVAGSEMGKAIVKGTIEGASETLSGVREGFSTIVNAMSKSQDQNDDDGNSSTDKSQQE
jgi:hypothetical protein